MCGNLANCHREKNGVHLVQVGHWSHCLILQLVSQKLFDQHTYMRHFSSLQCFWTDCTDWGQAASSACSLLLGMDHKPPLDSAASYVLSFHLQLIWSNLCKIVVHWWFYMGMYSHINWLVHLNTILCSPRPNYKIRRTCRGTGDIGTGDLIFDLMA